MYGLISKRPNFFVFFLLCNRHLSILRDYLPDVGPDFRLGEADKG